MEIRLVTLADVVELREISISTFVDAFGPANTTEDLDVYFEESRSIENLTKQLNADSQFYFLKDSNRTVGYLKVNFGQSQTETYIKNSIEVERLYIIGEYQGRGLGQLLLNKANELGLARGLETIWLGVWEHNPRAQRFYERLGYQTFGSHSFMLGSDKQTDILMKKSLIGSNT